MEVKKSSKADLERLRPRGFLLGLVLSLSCLFVALEYSFEPDDPLNDPELLEQLSADSELPPLLQPENELALAPKAKPEPTVKLKIVDDEEQSEPLQPDEPVETDLGDDMTETAEETPPEPPVDENGNPLIRVVEDLPQFPGGALEFIKWLTRNLKYPTTAQEQNVQGKVVAEFIVNIDGSVTDVKVVKSLHPACDREALRVLRMMPRWTPGIENARPCRTKVCIPIIFRL